VASNMFSLAEAKADGVSQPLAIYSDETMVGFTMFWYDDRNLKGYIDRLMIGHRFQRKGYGRAAMIGVIDRLKAYPESAKFKSHLCIKISRPIPSTPASDSEKTAKPPPMAKRQ